MDGYRIRPVGLCFKFLLVLRHSWLGDRNPVYVCESAKGFPTTSGGREPQESQWTPVHLESGRQNGRGVSREWEPGMYAVRLVCLMFLTLLGWLVASFTSLFSTDMTLLDRSCNDPFIFYCTFCVSFMSVCHGDLTSWTQKCCRLKMWRFANHCLALRMLVFVL